MRISDNHEYRNDISYIAGLNLPWEKLQGASLLISGASGLIGGVLVDSLMKHNELYGRGIMIYALGRNEESARARFSDYFDHSLFSFVKHDVNGPLPELGRMDYIIHAASNTHPTAYASDPIGTITANVFGTYHLLNYAVSHSTTRFTLLSTVEIYGENTGDTERFDEKSMGYIDCNTLRAGYPESKRASEAMCNAFSAQYGINTVIARLSRIYGPTMGDSDSKALSQFIRNSAAGHDIVLKSKGGQHFSFCYSADAVAAVLYIILLGESGEAYNVSDVKSDITLNRAAEILAAMTGVNIVYDLPDEVESIGFSPVTRALLDSAKLSALGWAARDTLESGLKKTVSILSNQ
jgi:nucleoside-diphosphate-sugar epimerase